MGNNINYNNIALEIEEDLLFITIAKYKLFLSYGKTGMDAMLLYIHLMFTARIQETNQVYAKDVYIRGGLKWGQKRTKRAKSLLKQLELIDYVQNKNKDGKFLESYIKVKIRKSPFEIESIEQPQGTLPPHPFTAPPVSDNKCLNEKDKCLNEKENAISQERLDIFNHIWDMYDKKVDKKNALKVFIKKISFKDFDAIFEHIPKYVKSTPNKKFRLNLSTYFNKESWNDEIIDNSEKIPDWKKPVSAEVFEKILRGEKLDV